MRSPSIKEGDLLQTGSASCLRLLIVKIVYGVAYLTSDTFYNV